MKPRIPLVLVPGLLCSDDLWTDQVAYLPDIAEIMVTAEHTRHDNLGAIADAVLAAAPAHFALAGLSMGGYIALEIMRRAPGRVLKLALLDTSARPDTPEQLSRRRGLIELAQKGRFRGVTPRLLPLLVHPARLDDAPLVARIVEMARIVGRDGFLRQQHAIMRRPDSRPTLKEIHCPSLVVCGREDGLTPLEWSGEIAAGIAGAKLSVIENCGHMSPMEQPGAVTAAMREWLQG